MHNLCVCVESTLSEEKENFLVQDQTKHKSRRVDVEEWLRERRERDEKKPLSLQTERTKKRRRGEKNLYLFHRSDFHGKDRFPSQKNKIENNSYQK